MTNYYSTLKRMMSYMRPYRGWAAIALFGVLGGTGLSIAIPAILRDVIDIGVENADANYMLSAGLLVVFLGFLRGVVGFLYRYFGERLSHHIAYDIRNQVYDKVQNQSFTYHDNAQTGTLITRAISDVLPDYRRCLPLGLDYGCLGLRCRAGHGAVLPRPAFRRAGFVCRRAQRLIPLFVGAK